MTKKLTNLRENCQLPLFIKQILFFYRKPTGDKPAGNTTTGNTTNTCRSRWLNFSGASLPLFFHRHFVTRWATTIIFGFQLRRHLRSTVVASRTQSNVGELWERKRTNPALKGLPEHERSAVYAPRSIRPGEHISILKQCQMEKRNAHWMLTLCTMGGVRRLSRGEECPID